jgi:hypothetical protein
MPMVRVAFTVNVVLMVAACAPAQTSRANAQTSLDMVSSFDVLGAGFVLYGLARDFHPGLPNSV